MSAFKFNANSRNGLDDRVRQEICAVDFVSEQRRKPYVRLPVLIAAAHWSHAYLGGSKRFTYHITLSERQMNWGERWPC